MSTRLAHRRALVFDQPCLNLELRGHTGLVWFVEDSGVLYAQAALPRPAERWLQPAPDVRVTPCDEHGQTAGGRLPARARLAWEAEAERARQLLRRKHGWLSRRWAALRAWLAGERLTWLVIQLSGQS